MNASAHILIVDDHREMRDLVSRALVKDGFRVSTAGDGKGTATLWLSAHRPDFARLDVAR